MSKKEKVKERKKNEDKTLFTAAVLSELSLCPIREIWSHKIEEMIERIAKAEEAGTLCDALHEIINEVKELWWIYEFHHLYNVLQNVAAEFGIALNE